ncbi:hypothetical protein [uncultured Arcticibacterium sp.]|uniref:hypothetical protein n=1 Tax=uncultured Arcticibacterium sp. TaxID=2173042 RepID=UPI0030F76114
MKSILLFLVIFSESSLSSLASSIDSLSHDSNIQNTVLEKPGLSALLKVGGYLNANSARTSYSSFKFNGHVELGFGENLSLNLGIESHESWTAYANDLNAVAEIRYFFDPIYKLKTGASFSGTYLAPSFSYILNNGSLNELPFLFAGSPESNRPYETNYALGLKFGRQFQGFVDFGVFGGIEKLQKKSRGKVSSGILKTYSSLALPIGNGDFNQLWRANLNQKVDNSYLLKFGINDVLSVSKKGFFFHPKIGYEYGFGKSGLSVNLTAEAFNYRAKFLDVSDSEISTESYLRQYISFFFSPELRYYLGHKGIEQGGSTLEGLYLKASAQVMTGTEEVKRQFWEYDKFSSFNLGLGLGAQKMLMGGILLDAHAGVFNDNELANNIFFGGGIDLYWVK